MVMSIILHLNNPTFDLANLRMPYKIYSVQYMDICTLHESCLKDHLYRRTPCL